MRRSLGIPATTSPARTSQRPARVRTRLTERKTATDVPLAGLSFGLDSVEGVGKASPEFIREMLTPLRTVKPQPLADKGSDVSDVRFYRVWANGKNGVRLEAKR